MIGIEMNEGGTKGKDYIGFTQRGEPVCRGRQSENTKRVKKECAVAWF